MDMITTQTKTFASHICSYVTERVYNNEIPKCTRLFKNCAHYTQCSSYPLAPLKTPAVASPGVLRGATGDELLSIWSAQFLNNLNARNWVLAAPLENIHEWVTIQ